MPCLRGFLSSRWAKHVEMGQTFWGDHGIWAIFSAGALRFPSRQYQRFWVTSCFEMRHSSPVNPLGCGPSQDPSGNGTLLKLGSSPVSDPVGSSSPPNQKKQGPSWRSTVGFFSGKKFGIRKHKFHHVEIWNHETMVFGWCFFCGLGSDGRWKSPSFNTHHLGSYFLNFFRLCIDHANRRKPGFLHDFHIAEPQWFQPNCWIWWPKTDAPQSNSQFLNLF